MNSKVLLTNLALIFLLISCGPSQEDYDKLLNENKNLLEKLEECNNGAEKLIALVNKSYKEKKYSEAKRYIQLLYSKHPESPKNKEFKKLLPTIEKKITAERKRNEAEEKERIRLANINNTGMWQVGYYVDNFGEPTKEGYIRNTNLIRGSFSNTATQDSKLDVKFLISNSRNISIQLYEYAGNNPVKAYATNYYSVSVQDKEGKRISLTAKNYSDRLTFDKKASRKIHKVLMKGGNLKFRIYETDTPTTKYQFRITNADWYENAYRILSGK